MSEDVETPKRKVPRKVTAAYLQRAAMAYLERYSASAEQLRRVLTRKVANRCRLRGEDATEFREAIDEVVAKSLRVGLIDDARYAQGRVASLRRRGGSSRAIRAKLSIKGVDRDTIAAALDGQEGDEENAALAFARRRRIGPFRVGERDNHRDKDLAAMARAGFGFALAKRILNGEIEGEI